MSSTCLGHNGPATTIIPAGNVKIKRAGPYLLGPKLGNSPVKSMIQCLARKEDSDEFYTLKILTLKNSPNDESIEDQQGKILLHTEYSLLSLLRDEPGIVRPHGIFKDTITEEVEINGKVVSRGPVSRLCLVLDCFTPHDFEPYYQRLTNLQTYVTKMKDNRLGEAEALRIFYSIVQIVERLHERNIVHRDLKLGNVIYDPETGEVTITNFCLGKKLISEGEQLTDQRGSPAYISPDVISGKPYLGKPSDMWALGVLFYAMLYGSFPFFDQKPSELFRKIRNGEYTPPSDISVSAQTLHLIRKLLVVNPKERFTASQVEKAVRRLIDVRKSKKPVEINDQVVPEMPPSPKVRSFSKVILKRKRIQSKSSISAIEAIIASPSSPVQSPDNDLRDEDKELVGDQEPPSKVAKSTTTEDYLPLPIS